MEQRIIDALKNVNLQEGNHTIELKLGGDMYADVDYTLKWEVSKTFSGTYMQPPEYEATDCTFNINDIYSNNDISISLARISREIENYLHKQLQ